MLNHEASTNTYSILIDPQIIENHLTRVDEKNYIQVNSTKLTWTPFVLSQDRLAHLLGENPKLTIKNVDDESMDIDIDWDNKWLFLFYMLNVIIEKDKLESGHHFAN